VFKRRKADHFDTNGAEGDAAADAAPEYRSTHTAPVKPAPGGASHLWAPKMSDGGLGVPPFRPAPTKEAESMARAPLTPVPATVPMPPSAAFRPTAVPAAPRGPAREMSTERRTLVVGRGISLQGTVQDAERLVVEGTVEASTIQAAELQIAHGGLLKGEIEVEDAEIAGTMDGTLTARGALVVRNTGRLLGTARCRRLQVEDGGQITGRIEMISDAAGTKLELPRATAESMA
jgi:cytoskeletal protein CcmA (bactofilin family)